MRTLQYDHGSCLKNCVAGNWLCVKVDEWVTSDEYKKMIKFFKDLRVVSDLAERCIKDIQDYAHFVKHSAFRNDTFLAVSDDLGSSKT